MTFRLKLNIEKLVNEMLASLPDHFWTSPNVTFCDPCMGSGQFIKAIVNKLKQYGHSDSSIKNRVFGYETNQARINYSIRKNKLIGNFKVVKEITNLSNSFDVIVGNPPFSGKTNNNPVWERDFQHLLDLCLNKNGYFISTIPPKWRKPESEIWNTLVKNNTLIYSKFFPNANNYINIIFDYVVVKKEKTDEYTFQVEDIHNKKYILDNKNWKFIPSSHLDKIEKLIDFSEKNTVDVIPCNYKSYESRKSWVSNDKCVEENYIYPLIHSYQRKTGEFRMLYSSTKNNGLFGESKVILTVGYTFRALNDYDGQYGMTQHACAIKINDKKQGELIEKYFNSDAFQSIVDAFFWNRSEIDDRVFKYFKKDFWNINL